MNKRIKANSSATLEVPIKQKLTLELKTICWLDACSNDGKYTKEEIIENLKPITCYSCGYIIREDEDVTILAQTYINELNKYEKILIIPTSLIVN